MTFQIFNQRVLILSFFLMVSVANFAQAQQPNMQMLMGQSLSKLQQHTPEAFLNCVAELKRIDAMFPDSIQPKYQIALQSLNFAVMNPQAPQTESLLMETEQTISQMEQMKEADMSDICTLRGFLYMVRIVQNPAQNGQRYYLDVMKYYEKALNINPDNQLAQQMQQKFFEGMKQQMGPQK